MSPEVYAYIRNGYDRHDKGKISELRAYDILAELPIVAKVEPTQAGDFYDADVYLLPCGKLSLSEVKLEVKSSRKGVAKFTSKIKDRYGLASEEEVNAWLAENLMVILVAWVHQEKEEIEQSFYRQLIDLSKYHGWSSAELPGLFPKE